MTKDTPMFVIESDATIVVPLILSALLECKANPKEANKLIKKYLSQIVLTCVFYFSSARIRIWSKNS